MQNIGIYGIGAIGTLLTKYLTGNRKNNCLFFNRSEKSEAIISFLGDESKIQFNLSPIEYQKLDWLIVCIKEYHIEEALSDMSKLINDKTKIAIFQNGINLTSPYMIFAMRSNILETIIDCSVQRNGNDHFVQLRKPIIILPDNPLAKEFIKVFGKADIDFIKTFNFLEAQWEKLIESSAIGAMQAYTGQTCIIFKQEKYLEEYMELVNEGIQVASSEGVFVNPFLTEQLLEKLKKYPDSKDSSMLADKLAGKELELNAKIGAILHIATKNGIDVPSTKRIYDLLVNSAHH